MDKDFTEIKEVGLKIIKNKGFAQPHNGLAVAFLLRLLFAAVLLLMALHLFPLWLAVPVGWALSIHLLNSLAQVSHFASHNALCVGHGSNQFLGTLASYCLGYAPGGHHAIHMEHHVHLNTEKDGDISWGSPFQTGQDFFRGLVRDLLGMQAFDRLMQYVRRNNRGSERSSSPQLKKTLANGLGVVVVQCALWAVLAVAGGAWWTYFLFWVFPICTLYPAQARLRSLVEHHIDEKRADHWFVRSTVASFVENEVISPCGQNYHLEHHLFPNVPAYYLKDLHHLLRERMDSPLLEPNTSYLSYAYRTFVSGHSRMAEAS